MWDAALRETLGEHIKGLLVEQEKYCSVTEPTWSFIECRAVHNLRLIFRFFIPVVFYTNEGGWVRQNTTVVGSYLLV
jgi:hypothetical protein